MRCVFLDTEYTGEHQHTTLVSVGLVTLEGESLYVTLNDYNQDQITDWLRENVLAIIDESKSVTSQEAYSIISEWLTDYAKGDGVRLISAGLGTDLILFYQLWQYAQPNLKYFHALHCLPTALNHVSHLDLNTMFSVLGIDPNFQRENYLDTAISGKRHDALYDANVVRSCFLKLIRNYPEIKHLML